MLTDRQVKNATTGLYADGAGLYLRVRPTGAKSWVFRQQTSEIDKSKAIGRYPQMSLAEARIAMGRIKRGLAASKITGEAAISAYMKKLAVRRPDQVRLILEPLNCAKSVESYTRQELVAQLQEKANTSPVMANRMLSRWKDLFAFCEQQGWIEHNPLAIVQRKYIGGKEVNRNRVLSWDEIVAFLRLPLKIETHRALYFILATGLRPSEALYVLSTAKLTNIPTKTTVRKVAPVFHVRSVIKKATTVANSHLTLSNALRRLKVGYTPHDLRRTFATRLSDLGVAPHVIEKLLHHRFEGVMAIYNHAEYYPEQVAAMRLWGRKLSELRRNARNLARILPPDAKKNPAEAG